MASLKEQIEELDRQMAVAPAMKTTLMPQRQALVEQLKRKETRDTAGYDPLTAAQEKQDEEMWKAGQTNLMQGLSSIPKKEVLPTKGIGPFASGQEYGKYLSKPEEKISTAPSTEERKELRKAIGDPGKLKLSRLDAFDPAYQEKMAEIAGREAEAQAALGKKKEALDWARVASVIGEGLTKYAAARRGLDADVDMSGVQVKTPDWSELLKEEERTYDRETAKLGREGKVAKDVSDERRRATEAEQAILNRQEQLNWQAQQDQARDARRFEQEKELASLKKKDESAATERELKEFEEKQRILSKYKKEPDDKKAIQREESLNALLGAYKFGDKDAIIKAELHAAQFLSPQDIEGLSKASGFFGGKGDKPEYVSGLIGQAPRPQPSTPTQGVKIQAPDGSIAVVPSDRVNYYVNKGGKIVQ